MSYPMKEVHEYGEDFYREMTPNEYLSSLTFYAELITRYTESKYRRDREYASYLKIWFSKDRCDGCGSFEERLMFRHLPMPYNIYFC